MAAKKPLVLDGLGNTGNLQAGDFIDVNMGGTGAVTAAGARTALGLSIGSAVQAWGASLDAVQALSTVGSVVRTGANTFVTRTMVPPAAGIAITNPDGVTGTPTFALANDLAAIENLAGTGFAVRTGTDAWTQRNMVTASASRLAVTNGDGVAGNPTLDLATVTNAGGGSLQKFTQDTYGRVTGSSPVVTADLSALLNTIYLSLSGGTLTGPLTLAADPVNPMDAATRQFVIGMANGQLAKDSVKAVAITNVTVANPGTSTFDTAVLSATGTNGAQDRLLLVGQTTQAENGPWLFNGPAVPLTRPTDFNTSALVRTGDTFLSTGGDVAGYKNSVWSLISPAPFVLGTTALTFTQINALADVVATGGLTKTGNALSAVLSARLNLTAGAIDLATTAIVPGQYTKVTFDTYGRAIAGSTAVPSDIGAQPASVDLTAIAALASTGVLIRTAAGNYAQRTLVAPAAGIAISNIDGVAGNPTFSLSNDLAALENLAGTGFATRTAVDTWVQRNMTGTARILITNPDGIAAAPSFDLASGVVAPGTYQSVTVDTYGRVVFGTVASTPSGIGSALISNEVSTIAICSAVYTDGNGTIKKANANSVGTSLVVGLAFTDINVGSNGVVTTSGEQSATTAQWDTITGQTGGLTPGAQYFLDNVTTGRITSNGAGITTGYIMPIGQAISTTKLLVRIGLRIQL